MNYETLAFDEMSKRTFDKNGYLHVSVSHISKETVNPYYGRTIPGWQERGLQPDKIYYGYREGTALALGAKTFNGLPLLLGHYEESAARPQKEHRVGSLGTDATFNSPYLDNSLIVTDAAAIRAIENGEARELSAAYRYTPVWESGSFNGEPYDFIMRNIEGNHVALVKEGRAGPDVVVADENDLKEENEMAKKAKDTDLENLTGLIKDAGLDPENEDVVKAFRAGMCCAQDKKACDEDEPDKKDDPKKAEDEDEPKKACDEDDPKDDDPKKAEDEDEPEDKKADDEDEPKDDDPKKAEDEDDPEDKKADDEDEPEEKKDEAKQAMDAAIIAQKVERRLTKQFSAKYKAAQECECILGRLKDPLAFDSAEDIYRKAITALGYDAKDIKDPAALRVLLAMGKKLGKQHVKPVRMAQDSRDRVDDTMKSVFDGLDSIRTM